jgi:hypothetical protein
MGKKRGSDFAGLYRRYNAWFGDSLRLPRKPQSKASTLRKQLWIQADQQISSLLAALKTRSAADLRQLVESPQAGEVREGRLVASLTAHAHEESSGKLAVIVEARQVCWAGFMHTVSAGGFYLRSDGTIEPMKEEDLWNHGY